MANMVLIQTMKSGLENLYKNWVHGQYVTLRFAEKNWKCKVERVAGHCKLEEGWYNFVKDSGVGVKDYLVMYTLYDDIYYVNACIYRHEEYASYSTEGNGVMLIYFKHYLDYYKMKDYEI